MATRKKTKPKAQRPKVVKVVRVKYVQRKESNPFGNVNKMVGTGVGAIIGVSMAGAVVKGLKSI